MEDNKVPFVKYLLHMNEKLVQDMFEEWASWKLSRDTAKAIGDDDIFSFQIEKTDSSAATMNELISEVT